MDPDEGLIGLLEASGLEDTPEAAERLRRFLELLGKWNERINLTGSTSWQAMAPLLQEALLAGRFYPDIESEHLDIGSGAGFPAIPLKVVRPRMKLTMVESRMKRAVFLETVLRELGLTGRVVGARLEEFLEGRETPGWDSISWKGVRIASGDLVRLIDASRPEAIFLVFHGATLPVGDAGILETRLRLRRREAVPLRPAWYVSIYEKRRGEAVSRETGFRSRPS